MENTQTGQQTVHFFEQALPRCVIKVGSYTVELLNWGKIEPYLWHNVPHFHAFYEICYNWTGSGTYTVDGKRHDVCEDCFLLAWPKEEHSMLADQASPFGVYCASIGIYPSGNEEEDDLTELFRNFIGTDKRVIPSVGAGRVCELISEEICHRGPGFEQSLTGLFTKFIFDAINACGKQVMAVPSHIPLRNQPEQLRFRNALNYIENNYSKPITVPDIAQRLYVSERHANRLFRQLTGFPVMKFIQDYRMKIAMQMLENTARPIKEIACACGYPNERNFMTRFHKYTNMTATVYRKSREKTGLHEKAR